MFHLEMGGLKIVYTGTLGFGGLFAMTTFALRIVLHNLRHMNIMGGFKSVRVNARKMNSKLNRFVNRMPEGFPGRRI